MKIRKLHIKNYKVFDDLELDFTDANGVTLDKIVLAGVNGCGKTTILEIIKKMYDGTLSDYFINFSEGFIEIEIELTVLEKINLQKHLDTLFNDTNMKIYDTNKLMKSKYSDFFTRLTSSKRDLSLKYMKGIGIFYGIVFSNNIHKNSARLLYLSINNNVKNYISKKKIGHNNFEIIHLDSSKNQMKQLALKEIRNEVFKNEDTAPRQSKEKAIKQITKALTGMNLTTKLVDLESEELIFESVNGQKIKFEDLSNGEQTLYFRAIYLSKLNPQNSIIMIDEPEDSLHPTWQQKVLKLYQNIGENNQLIVATHSPHIIGSSNAEEVFLLEIDENQVEAVHPKYTKGHSIDYILEVMGANPRDTTVISTVEAYLTLIRKGQHQTEKGLKLKSEIDALNLDPNSEEMRRLDLSIKRFKAVQV